MARDRDVAPASTPEPDVPAGFVRARWVSPHPVWNPEQGIIAYGDAILVSVEQLADPNTPAVEWDDSWTADPALAAVAAAEEA